MKNIIFENELNQDGNNNLNQNNNQNSVQILKDTEKEGGQDIFSAFQNAEKIKDDAKLASDEKIKSSQTVEDVLKKIVEERYDKNLRRITDMIKKINSEEEEIIKSQMPEEDRSGNINLPNQIYNMFERTNVKNSIVNFIIYEFENIDSYYEKKFNEKVEKVLNIYLDKSEKSGYDKKIINNINKLMDEFIYFGMSEYLIGNKSQNEIQQTYNNSPFLKKPYVENLFQKINNILKYAILNDKNISNINDVNAFETTKESVNKDWFEFSKNVLEEEPISSVDDIFLGSYKLLIKAVNKRIKDDGPTGIKQYSDNETTSETKLYKNISNIILEDDKSQQNNGKSLSDYKFDIINSYNNYRKELYNYGKKYNDYIKYDNNLFERFANELSDINKYKNITKDLAYKELNNILKEIVNIIKNLKKNNKDNLNNKKTDGLNNEETFEEKQRRGIINSIQLFKTMASIYTNYSQKFVSEMLSEWKKMRKDGIIDDNEINDLLKKLNRKMGEEINETKSLFLGDLIIINLCKGMIDYGEKNGIDMNEIILDSKTLTNISDEDLKKFYMLMNRFPTTEDYDNYKNVYEKISSMNNIFDKLLSKYEEALTKSWFFQTGFKYLFGDYYLIKDKKIKYDIWNTLLGDSNISPEIISFLREALAYMHLTNIAHRKNDNKMSKDEEERTNIAKEIIGNTNGITEKDICGIFASAGSTNPGSLSVNSMITILMSSGFLKQQKIKCTRSFSPSRFYDTNPVLITSEDGKQLIGVITFYSFDKLTNLSKSGTNFGKWLYNFIMKKNDNSIV